MVPDGTTRTQPVRKSWRAAAGGAGLGMMGASMYGVVLCLIGGLLCLTGIGAIIGIPLVIAGGVCLLGWPLAGVVGAWMGRREESVRVMGACPYCHASLTAWGQGFDCPICGQRIIHRGGMFMTLEQAEKG